MKKNLTRPYSDLSHIEILQICQQNALGLVCGNNDAFLNVYDALKQLPELDPCRPMKLILLECSFWAEIMYLTLFHLRYIQYLTYENRIKLRDLMLEMAHKNYPHAVNNAYFVRMVNDVELYNMKWESFEPTLPNLDMQGPRWTSMSLESDAEEWEETTHFRTKR